MTPTSQSFAELTLNVAASASSTLRRETMTRSASSMALDSLDSLAEHARALLAAPSVDVVPGPWERVKDAAQRISGLANDGLDGPADGAIVRDLAQQIVALAEEQS